MFFCPVLYTWNDPAKWCPLIDFFQQVNPPNDLDGSVSAPPFLSNMWTKFLIFTFTNQVLPNIHTFVILVDNPSCLNVLSLPLSTLILSYLQVMPCTDANFERFALDK